MKDEGEKFSGLMWDKFHVQPHVWYDLKKDLIVGFKHYGTISTSKFAEHMLVFLVHTLKTGAKKAISYYYANSGTT